MDIFKQKRYLVLLVGLLIILNLATLIMFWLNKPQHPVLDRKQLGPARESEHIQQLLKDELDFDDAQVEAYLTMRKDQSKKVSALQKEINQLKKQMFDEILKDIPQPVLSDSLLKLSQEKMVELEQLTFQYLLDLKKLCKPEQQHNLKLLINEFFRQNSPREMKNDMPPPPPRGDELPPNKN